MIGGYGLAMTWLNSTFFSIICSLN